MKVKEDLSED